MNNNTYMQRDDSIGTDPTVLNVIDSLDVEPTVVEEQKPKKTKKPSGPKKKLTLPQMILLGVAVVALIGGVAFGLFYYLRVGNQKGGAGANSTVLNPVKIFVGEPVPEDVLSYGDFSKVDIATCTMDSSKIDTSKTGTYDLTITCDKESYKAKVIVEERLNYDAEGLIALKTSKSEYQVTDFIKANSDYEVTFKDESILKMTIDSVGGPFPVEIIVKDESGNETTIYSALYTFQTAPKSTITCSADNQSDYLSFNPSYELLNTSLRTKTFTFEDENEYYNTIKSISNSRLTIENFSGVPVTNEKKKEITIVSELSSDTLRQEYGSDFPKEYNVIRNYYKDKKSAVCSNLT